MSESSDQGEKVHDPTPQKLEDARRKGDIARSMDVSAAAGMIGLYIVLAFSGAQILHDSGAVLAAFFDRADGFTGMIAGSGGIDMALSWVEAVLTPLAALFLMPFALALASLLAQRAFAFAPDKIVPKLNRLSLIANAKQKFGLSGLFQFAKSAVKMSVITCVLILYLIENNDRIIGSVNGSKFTVLAMIGETVLAITLYSCLVFGAIAVIDLMWQRYDHARKLRMSYQDLKDEQKSSEGDPHTKQQRRQRGQDIATNRMLLEVPNADVVIVNPSHYAVALKWDRKSGSAPVCVAKGVDEIAASIRELAAQHGVPIQRDPPTARAIHASVEIGEEIEVEHYRAVAAALNFAEEMRRKARERGIHGSR